ncbi:MAG: Gfo/Idh/MocA family oxidoreductase [Saprospiraceae bacterium]|nr:Gfo/Idh/MocA family oxidoreductase [Saprospiraceae bacterium]
MKQKEKHIAWGIIGCGDVAEVKSGPAFQNCDQSELVAVMRRNGEKAKDFAERHKVPLWYDDASLLLKNDDINAVYVATPPSTHLEYALKSLEVGKDVYLEKPMVLNEDEALVLKEAVNQSKNKLVVAHYRRHLPMYLKVKELVDSNAIGQIEYVDIKYLIEHDKNINSNWRIDPSVSGGGLFHDLAPHQLDLMYYFFGDYKQVAGFATSHEEEYQMSDSVNGIIGFKNGIQFRGIWNFNVPEYIAEDNCTIHGSKGTIQFPFYGSQLKWTVGSETTTNNFKNPVNIQQPLIQETVNYFLDLRTNPCSVEEGLVVTSIMDKFTHNINT